MHCLDVASVVHDIGIKPAEERYGKGHCGGKLQEQLGPEPARKMLTELDFDEDIIDRVCFLIAHHHTYEGAQGLDWQILLEADFLVNAFEDSLSKESIKILERRDRVHGARGHEKAPERKTCQAGQARLGQCAILQEAYGRKGCNA